MTRRLTVLGVRPLLVLIFLFCFFSQAAAEEDITYPRNEVRRPLTLPKGMGEVELRLAEFQWTANREIERGELNLGILSAGIRYGLTDNLQINNLGLGYRILRGKKSELLLYGMIDDASIHFEKYSTISASAGLVSKIRLGNASAVLLEVYDNYRFHSSISDENTVGGSAGFMYSLTDSLSALVKAGYEERMLAADLDVAAIGAGLRVQHSLARSLDIVYALDVDRVQNINSNDSDYTDGQFSISIKWRW